MGNELHDVLDAIDFFVDLVCMMPPLEQADLGGVPPGLLLAACLGSVFLLLVSVTGSALKDAFAGKGVVAAVAAVCVCLIGFLSMDQSALGGLYVVGYPALVISLRGAEGMIIGSKYGPAARFWHCGAFLGAGIVIYVALLQLPAPSLRIAKGAWAVLGAVVASQGWTAKISQPGNFPFDSPFSKFSLFLVFITTMLYVQSSNVDRLLFQWVFPVGIVLGVVTGRVDKQARQGKEHDPTPG